MNDYSWTYTQFKIKKSQSVVDMMSIFRSKQYLLIFLRILEAFLPKGLKSVVDDLLVKGIVLIGLLKWHLSWHQIEKDNSKSEDVRVNWVIDVLSDAHWILRILPFFIMNLGVVRVENTSFDKHLWRHILGGTTLGFIDGDAGWAETKIYNLDLEIISDQNVVYF